MLNIKKFLPAVTEILVRTDGWIDRHTSVIYRFITGLGLVVNNKLNLSERIVALLSDAK